MQPSVPNKQDAEHAECAEDTHYTPSAVHHQEGHDQAVLHVSEPAWLITAQAYSQLSWFA